MRRLSAFARFFCLQLVVHAAPADPPGNIVILEPGESSFTVSWTPGNSNDCTFQAWQVQLRSRNLNGTLVGSWRDACEVPTSRENPNCTVLNLQRNSPYDLQIQERCSTSTEDSAAGEPEQVLWTLPGYWDIHIPPHDSSTYVVEDTLEAHAGCEIIKSCCDDQFSLCFSGNESRTVEVQRVDTELGWQQQVGWGQDLYLRCHAPSVASFKTDPISQEPPEAPWYLRLYEATHVTARVIFHHGNVIGGCQCANHQLQTRPEGSDAWRNEAGDCLVRDSRQCSIQNLQANARIYGRMQTTCLDQSMNSNWSDIVEVITRPACTWTYDSSIQGALSANELECVDKSFCDFETDPSCCASRGGRLRCPSNYSVMCQNQACVGSTDYCCVSSDAECAAYGGVRVCSPSMVPAEVPRFEGFASYLASSLRIAWSRGVYLSKDDSPCRFATWQIEVAETYANGTNGSWVLMSNCATLQAEATSCEVGPSQGLISLQSYVVRMKEICTEPALNSEFSYASGIATTWPMRAYPVSNVSFSDIRDHTLTISWVPGIPYERHVQECDFDHWEVMIRLEPRYVQTGRAFGEISWDAVEPERDDLYAEYEFGTEWYLGCRSFTRDQSNCQPESLESDRDYDVKVRERCRDAHADGDYTTSSSKVRTAAVAAHAPENFTTSEIRKYRYDLSWDPGDRRACVFWAWQVMTKPVGVDWPPEDQDNATIEGGQHFFVYARNITEVRFKLPLRSNTQYGARVRERCTNPNFDGAWGYLLYPGVWTAPPVQAEQLSNVTFLFNWPALLSVRFLAGPEGWLEDLDPGAPGYNSHSDCEFQGWYVEVSDPSTPSTWVVQQECLAISRSFEGCDIYSGLEYGKAYNLRLREGCTDPSARSPEYVTTVTARDRTPAATPVDLTKNSDTAFSYEFSWDPGPSYDCVFLRWEVQLRSINDTNSSAAAYGDGQISEIRSRIYGHSQNPSGVSSLDWSVPVEACALPDNRQLAWCRIQPLIPNALIDLRVREICQDSSLNSPYAVLETKSPEAPATQFTSVSFVGATDDGNALEVQFSGANVGDCLDAIPQIEVKMKGELTWTSVTQVSYELSQSAPHEPHDLISGVITAYLLQPNTIYFGQVRLYCPSGNKDGPFLQADQQVPTLPGCKWSRHSNRSQMSQCSDGSFCNFTADETCCGSNLQRCPPERPWLCSSGTCEVDCTSFGGKVACSAAQWPANMPQIFEANSFAPATLTLSWGPQDYLSGNVSSCTFSRWDLQMAKVAVDGSLESWVPLSHCFFEGSRQQQTCQVENLDFLQYYQVRFAELCSDSSLDSLYNWTHPILIRGALAGVPANVTMTVLSSSHIHIGWDASNAVSDCSFFAWEVQWRLASEQTWSPASECQDLIYRNQTECIIRGVAAMQSYVVRITETCTDARTNSPPSDTPTFRFREVDDWEIYLGPSASMSLAVPTLAKEVDRCEVLTTCCDDQFSICYSTTASEQLLATISRTDFVAGWGQQLWLRCYVNSATTPDLVAAAAPLRIELQTPSRTSMSASYSLGQAPGDCLCAQPHLQVKADSDSTWVTMQGDCADMSLRACSLTDLLPDRVYVARLQLACSNSSMNSPWTYSATGTTDPGCKWLSSSGNATGYQCKDGTYCDAAGCCSGNLLRCPDATPFMCADSSCGGDHCCVQTSSSCAALGGLRPCADSEVPAKEPIIQSVESLTPSSLLVTWSAGSYASGFTAPCAQGGISEFTRWDLEVAPVQASTWQSVTCANLRTSTSCSVENLMPNTAYQVRLAEICLHSDLSSDFAVSAGSTKPFAASSPTDVSMELSGSMLNLTWLPGANAGDCIFQSWELQWRLWSSSATSSDWTSMTCSSSRASSGCLLQQPVDIIELRLRERCQDPNADSPFLTAAPFKWTSMDAWEVYVGSSSSPVISVDVLLLPNHVVAKAGAGAGSFSLCFGTSQVVTVTRTDASGWSEDLWLQCSLRSPVSNLWLAPSVPDTMTLVPGMDTLKAATLTASFQAVEDMGSGCTCGRFDLELQAMNYSTPYGYAHEESAGKPSGSCSAGTSLSSRSCMAEALRPDATYHAFLSVQCDEGRSNVTSGSFVTPPACKWVAHSGYADLYECVDGLLCNSTSCCNSHGGRARCPQQMPVMCAKNLDCADGQDRCCVASEAECQSHSGVRPCFYAEVPAKAPVISQVSSPAPGQLMVQWQHASYMNGHRSRCSFSSWRVEATVDDTNDGGAQWQLARECVAQDRPVTSCLLQNLQSNSNYSLRLREACTRMDYDSDWALWPDAVTLPTPAAAPTATCVQPAVQNAGAMRLQITWSPGSPGDCVFQAWEVYLQLLPSTTSSWMLVCNVQSLQDTSCYVDALISGRYYAVRTRKVCSDPAASSAFGELTGTQCLVTAVAAASPVNLTAVSISPYDLEVNWAAMHPWACTFHAWQVQVKTQAADSWESGFGCFSYDRDMANCTVNVALGSNTPYDVRVRESCVEPSLSSAYLQLAFPGVSTPLPVKADTPTALAVTQVSAFDLRVTWQAGSSNGDCSFSSWEVLLGAEALPCPSARDVGRCDVSLRQLSTLTSGTYSLQVREICSDTFANSDALRQDSALQFAEPPAPMADLALHDAGETWLLFTWASGLSACNTLQYQIHWRQLASSTWAMTLCNNLPCNVSGLLRNTAYEVLVEEACQNPWSMPTISNETSGFWTMPGEWSTWIGNSNVMTVSLVLSHLPHRCYVQKECCADEFSICHNAADRRSVEVMRVDVPGGWGQRLTLQCVQPVLSTVNPRPQVQVTGPESLLLAPRDNESVTVVYPLRMAANVAGCECPAIVLEMTVQGTATWLSQSGGLCNDWSSRECVVDGLQPGTTYEGRMRITCQEAALSSAWTYAGATVTTNLEALIVQGSLSVTASASRRLAAAQNRRAAAAMQQQVQKVLSEVTGLELRSVMVTGPSDADLSYVLAASTLGTDDVAAELAAAETQRRLEESLATDFAGRLSTEAGSSVDVKVVIPPDISRQSDAFSSCGLPPTVANSDRSWSSASCLGRTWSDGPCPVPCDVGFLPEGDGFLCGVDGDWSSPPRCASIWSVAEWGVCEGVDGNCGDGGLQRREVSCPDTSGCHAMSKPTEEQSCRATHGCVWVEGQWSSCSNDCGLGDRFRSVTCSSPLAADCADKALPPSNESCSDYSNCQWQIKSWSLCSSSCGVGTQTREVTCEADPHCPEPSPALVQYCYETSTCSWQTAAWSTCSNSCGAGAQDRQVWCSSGVPEDCAGDRPLATQSCYDTVGCTWQKGSWSACSSTCGPGQRQRDVTCPSGQAADCPGAMPATMEDCYETSGCFWETQSWSACDNTCGTGTRTRSVSCSVTRLDADCSAAGTKPIALQSCYDVVGCAWIQGSWSACSATCGAGLRSRSVTCPSGWPADCAQFQVEPASTEICRESSTCQWRTGEWSSCSNDCGDGTMVRTVQCSSGEDMDCTAEKPATTQSCRVTSGCGWSISAWSGCDVSCGAGVQRRSAMCDSGLPSECSAQPVVIQSCYATTGCSWQQGDWSSCSSTCGLGLRQRSVGCSSGSDADCVAAERPSSSEACYERSGCSWQFSAWSSCSETCGAGLRTRQVWCDSLVDADCQGNLMPARSEECYNTSTCAWTEAPWSECSNDCGQGTEVRSISCSGSRGDADCAHLAAPSTSRSCFSAANCAWHVEPWQLCNVSCGIGHQERQISCPTGSDSDCPLQRPSVLQRCYRQDGCRWLEGPWSPCTGVCEAGTRSRNLTCLSGDDADCSQVVRPLDQEACNQQAPGCLWSLGEWSTCSATSCGAIGSRVRLVQCPSRHRDAGCAASKPREVEACLSEAVCEWRLETEWSDCDASCGWGVSTRVVSCSAGREEDCPGEKPASSKECYSTTGCQWWTGQWGNCNATCGLGYETRSLVCGADSCDPSTAPLGERACHSVLDCDWFVGDWGACSSACGDGVLERLVQCPSGSDADCAWRPRPLDRKACRNVTGCEWSSSPWSVCSQSCGEGTQTRAVLCPSGEDTDCGASAPATVQRCQGTFGCSWQVGDWSSCSNHCGDGTRQRSVLCNGETEHCNASTRPLDQEPCSSSACDAWLLGAWSPCSTSCGQGVQQRSVQCKDPGSCGERPPAEQVCFDTSSCRWLLGPWSNCSEGCGLGTRSRSVTCSGGGASLCSAPRPADRVSCESAARSMIGPSCGWTVGAWSACAVDCGPQQREVTCGVSKCFGKPPSALQACEDAACENQAKATARFDLSLLMDDLSTTMLWDLVAGTRQAVAEMLEVPAAEVQVKVVNGTSARRLSVMVKLEVEVVSSLGRVSMLSSEQGKEMLHSELLESWDEQGLPLEDFSVLLSPVETQQEALSTASPSTTRLTETAEPLPSNLSNVVVLVVVLCTLLCSAVAGVLYCWRWRSSVAVVPQSPKLLPPTSPCPQPQGGPDALKSPKGGASPAAVSAMRRAASEHETRQLVADAAVTLPVEARKVHHVAGDTTEVKDKPGHRPSAVQVRVVQAGEKPSARAVRVTNATVTRSATAVSSSSRRSSSSRSPLSHAPRPSEALDAAPRTSRSEGHRLPLEGR